MENALRAKPLDVREQYERQLKELQEAYGEAMLELRAKKKKNWRPCWARKTSNRDHPPGTQRRRFRCSCQQDMRVVWDCQAHRLLQAGEG